MCFTKPSQSTHEVVPFGISSMEDTDQDGVREFTGHSVVKQPVVYRRTRWLAEHSVNQPVVYRRRRWRAGHSEVKQPVVYRRRRWRAGHTEVKQPVAYSHTSWTAGHSDMKSMLLALKGKDKYDSGMVQDKPSERKIGGDARVTNIAYAHPNGTFASDEMKKIIEEEERQNERILAGLLQLEEKKLQIVAQILELEEQRFKCTRFFSKEEKELENKKLKNKAIKLEIKQLLLERKRRKMRPPLTESCGST